MSSPLAAELSARCPRLAAWRASRQQRMAQMDQLNAIDKVVIGGVPAAPEVSVSPPESLAAVQSARSSRLAAWRARISKPVVLPPSQEGPQEVVPQQSSQEVVPQCPQVGAPKSVSESEVPVAVPDDASSPTDVLPEELPSVLPKSKKASRKTKGRGTPLDDPATMATSPVVNPQSHWTPPPLDYDACMEKIRLSIEAEEFLKASHEALEEKMAVEDHHTALWAVANTLCQTYDCHVDDPRVQRVLVDMDSKWQTIDRGCSFYEENLHIREMWGVASYLCFSMRCELGDRRVQEELAKYHKVWLARIDPQGSTGRMAELEQAWPALEQSESESGDSDQDSDWPVHEEDLFSDFEDDLQEKLVPDF